MNKVDYGSYPILENVFYHFTLPNSQRSKIMNRGIKKKLHTENERARSEKVESVKLDKERGRGEVEFFYLDVFSIPPVSAQFQPIQFGC